jgi:hypothetical protein
VAEQVREVDAIDDSVAVGVPLTARAPVGELNREIKVVHVTVCVEVAVALRVSGRWRGEERDHHHCGARTHGADELCSIDSV